MPIIAAPPRAVETAPAPVPGSASPAKGAIAELTVPSQAVLLPLQPSKLTVYRLFVDQVRPGRTLWQDAVALPQQTLLLMTRLLALLLLLLLLVLLQRIRWQ